MRLWFFIFIISLPLTSVAQSLVNRKLPGTAINGQFAGSIGFFSAGYSRVSPHHKIEAGFHYGYVPKNFGGELHIVTLKGMFNPFQLDIKEKLSLEPMHTGAFIAANFGKGLALAWDSRYPKGYYWWSRSVRFHLFFGSQIAWKVDAAHLQKIALYIEANTNDLYISSYYTNPGVLSLWDILFLGTGLKFYLR